MTTEQMDWLDDERSGRHAAVTPPDRELDSSVVNGGRSHMSPEQQVMAREMSQPKPIGKVLDEFMGEQNIDADVDRMAHVLLEEHCAELRTGLKEWAMIQRAVEAAIRLDPRDL
ncbi:hypothetical protein SEA_MERCEDES_57 [Microbacterium phage Mercedes]|nr:hypothetical protein SEA_MERCEDES_57 [Microbacterium phage Mercedes]